VLTWHYTAQEQTVPHFETAQSASPV
jgi:hypothetical protein